MKDPAATCRVKTERIIPRSLLLGIIHLKARTKPSIWTGGRLEKGGVFTPCSTFKEIPANHYRPGYSSDDKKSDE